MQTNQSAASEKIGVIDIGSNSVRFVVFEIYGASFTPVYNEKVLAGLGRDLARTGRLHPQGSEQAFSALARFKLLAGAQGLSQILIAATAALRDAGDAKEFIGRVRREIGFDIKPLSGEQEAFISALGVIAGDKRAAGIAADLGGASLEMIGVRGGKAFGGETYPLGPFSMFKGEFSPDVLRPQIKKMLQSGADYLSGQNLYLIGGAWRNLAIIHQKRTGYPLRVAHNYSLSPQEALLMADWACSAEGIEEILNWRGLSERRADTLPYSGLLLGILIQQLKPKSVILAPGGLRDGLVYNAFPDAVKQRSALFDACRALAQGRQQGKNFGLPLYEFLGGISDILPRGFETGNEERLRGAACLLVGIGKGLHPDHKARMVFRTVLYAPLPELTHAERAYLALMLFSSYTSKKTSPNDEALSHLLSADRQNAARLYGEAMRLGVVLSGRSWKALSKFTLQSTKGDGAEGGIELTLKKGAEPLLIELGKTRLSRLENLLNSPVKSIEKPVITNIS